MRRRGRPNLADAGPKRFMLHAMFSRRRPLRRWATGLVLLWLFGIGASFANACLAATRAGTVAATPAAVTAAVGDTSACPHHLQAPVAATGDAPATGKTNCQDFCEKSTISIPPLQLSIDHADAGATAPPPAPMLFELPAAARVSPEVPRRDGGRAPPIPIAFLRLAL